LDLPNMRTLARWIVRVILIALLLVIVTLACLRFAAAWRESAGASPPPGGRIVSTAKGDLFVQTRGPDSGAPVLW
jgi:hypothetical protein